MKSPLSRKNAAFFGMMVLCLILLPGVHASETIRDFAGIETVSSSNNPNWAGIYFCINSSLTNTTYLSGVHLAPSCSAQKMRIYNGTGNYLNEAGVLSGDYIRYASAADQKKLIPGSCYRVFVGIDTTTNYARTYDNSDLSFPYSLNPYVYNTNGSVACTVATSCYDPNLVFGTANFYNLYGLIFNDTGGGAPPPAAFPFVKINAKDKYNGADVAALNVTLSDGMSNLTDPSGIATFNHSGNIGFNITDPDNHRYFTYISTTNATENATTSVNVTGAWPRINATNLLGAYIQNFTACSPEGCNSTTTSAVRLILPPNTTGIPIVFVVYDGNHTAAVNDTNQTYPNQTKTVTTTGQDLGFKTATRLFQANLTVNVSIGTTAAYIANFSLNLTGPVNNNSNTTSYNINILLMNGDYEAVALPEGYSLSYKNFTISYRNYTPRITIPAYSLNSFYLSIRDEISRALITENMTIELISELTAGIYNTINGTKALELLTPGDYTIRYHSANYSERDFYQTLINLNYYTINLYGLLETEGKSLIVTVVDTSGEPIENATVKISRYYTYCNCYEVVEMSKTAASGEAYFSIDEVDGHYKMAVDYGGVNEFVSTSPENFYSTTSLITRVITIDLGSDYYQSYRAVYGVGHSLTYNNNTGALSFTWSDPSGLVRQGCINAEYLSGVHYTQLTPACQNATTGSVILSLPNYGNVTYRYKASLNFNTAYSIWDVYTGIIDTTTAFDFGPFGAFIGGGLIVTLALIMSYSAIAVVIITVVGMAAMFVIGLVPLGSVFIMGFATLGLGLAVYFMRS